MKKITVLLPVDDTEKHIEAVCDGTDFEIDGLGNWMNLPSHHFVPKEVRLVKTEVNKKKKGAKQNDPIGDIKILPARDNSVVVFSDHSVSSEKFSEFSQLIVKHFQDLNFLIETRAEPWRKSPDKNRERDKTIWECRNLGETWERTA